MLPAAARLRRRADFTTTVRSGRRRGHGAVAVHLAHSTDKADASPRVGFVVSKAVGPAVARNRVRRRLQHLVRDRLGQLPPGASLVVRALPGAAERSYPLLAADVDAALHGALSGKPGKRGRSGERGRSGTGGLRRNKSQPAAMESAPPQHATDGDPGAEPAPGEQPQSGVAPLARALTWPIVAYRRWVSPALPARCRFYPTCSTYAIDALRTHGALRGIALTIWRLLRCHPFHPGGYDPVPPAPARRNRVTATGA